MPEDDGVAAAPATRATAQPPASAMPHAAIQWFVYYRVAAEDLAPAQAAVRQFQQLLAAQWPGLACSLLRRPDTPDGRVTLMETYVPASFTATGAEAPGQRGIGSAFGGLPARLEQGPPALAAWLQGERHLETFVPCA